MKDSVYNEANEEHAWQMLCQEIRDRRKAVEQLDAEVAKLDQYIKAQARALRQPITIQLQRA